MRIILKNKKEFNSEIKFNLEGLIVLDYDQLLQVNGAGGGSSGGGAGGPSGGSTGHNDRNDNNTDLPQSPTDAINQGYTKY